MAGPIVVAAVSLKSFRFVHRIDDSKKLSAQQRERAFGEIVQKAAFGIGMMNETAIDTLNISGAAKLAVDIAVEKLLAQIKRPRPTWKNTLLLLDGRLSCSHPYHCREIIGGDGKSLSIACASIVAKVIRDRVMAIYDRIYPEYDFGVHKGYGTRRHFSSIARFGLSPLHRRTFCKGTGAR